ncbi:MAG: hypothetical protein ACREQ5_11645, partial [Candidatus Dormibacteria bacterium]
TKVFIVYSDAGASVVLADLVSLDSDGFTLNFSKVDANARLINYIALGGADLTNAFVKQIQGPGATGDQAYTGVGFKPDAIISMSSGDGTTPASSETTTETKWFGFATASAQEVSYASVVGGPNRQQLAKIVAKDASMYATLKSMDSDGYTFNWSAVSGKFFYVLALKGGQYAVGTFLQPTVTGNHADVTGLAFQPTGVILASVGAAASATDHTTSPAAISVGAASDSSSMGSIWNGGTTGGIMDNNTSTAEVIQTITSGSSPTVTGAAELVSFDSGGFTNHWTTADGTAREIIYFAMGSSKITSQFLEPGGDTDFGIGFWTGHGSGGSPTVATDFVNGSHIKSLKFSTSVNNVYVYKQAIGADSGGRISMYVYLNALPSAAASLFGMETVGDGSIVFQVQITSGGVLQLGNGGSTQMGSNGSTLSTGTWYRLCLTWNITSSSVNTFKLFKGGTIDITVTNATLTGTGTSDLVVGTYGGITTFPDLRVSDIYVDDSTGNTDPGNIWVTAKRPNANGTTNGYTTQIGSGGSSYGTGHSPQVNERPNSDTNGWSMVGAGSAITEEYNIESVSQGDINITSSTIVDYVGWVRSKSLASETAQIIVNGVSSNISLTSTTAFFTKVAGSTTYPAGSGSDIGEITSTDLTTVSLYEAGVIVAYVPSVVTTAVKSQGVRGWSWAI